MNVSTARLRMSLTAFLVALHLSLLAAGTTVCGCGTELTTTSTLPSVTEPAAETTTSAVATTAEMATTTQPAPQGAATETTAAAGPVGIDPELVSTKRSLDDVEAAVHAGREIGEPVNVTPDLQQQYAVIHPGRQILYIGPNNRGDPRDLTANEMNNCLVTVEGDASTQCTSFGGLGPADGYTGEPGLYDRIVMEFEDVVLIPETDDFYLRGSDPFHEGTDIYVRVVVGSNTTTGFLPTLVSCLDLARTDGFEGTSGDYITGMLKTHSFKEYVIPGDTLCVFAEKIFGSTTPVTSGEGREVYPFTLAVDERGCQVAFALAVIRCKGADKIAALCAAVKPHLGVEIETVTPEVQQEAGLAVPTGVFVRSVEPRSPAAEAGVQAGDVITGLSGTPVYEAEQLIILLLEQGAGATVKLGIDRGGTKLTLQVAMGKASG